jgi:hypothetical protein
MARMRIWAGDQSAAATPAGCFEAGYRRAVI